MIYWKPSHNKFTLCSSLSMTQTYTQECSKPFGNWKMRLVIVWMNSEKLLLKTRGMIYTELSSSLYSNFLSQRQYFGKAAIHCMLHICCDLDFTHFLQTTACIWYILGGCNEESTGYQQDFESSHFLQRDCYFHQKIWYVT
jgi:hypothetical protein